MIFPQTEEKVLCLSWCCSASPLVTGAGQRGDHTGQSELVSPTKRTTSHHTTAPQHQDGAWHCLPPDHLDRLGSFLGHRSECCEWLKLLIPSLCEGHPLIKAQSKYSFIFCALKWKVQKSNLEIFYNSQNMLFNFHCWLICQQLTIIGKNWTIFVKVKFPFVPGLTIRYWVLGWLLPNNKTIMAVIYPWGQKP